MCRDVKKAYTVFERKKKLCADGKWRCNPFIFTVTFIQKTFNTPRDIEYNLVLWAKQQKFKGNPKKDKEN